MTHGGSPRTRRMRQTGQEPDPQVKINTDKLLDQFVSAAVGSVAGLLVSRALENK